MVYIRMKPGIVLMVYVLASWASADLPAQEASPDVSGDSVRTGGTVIDSAHAIHGQGVVSAIDERMREFVRQGKITGAVTLVMRRGRVLHLGAVGHADVEKHHSMRTDSIFGIASMTKPITATALMILYEEGKLALDDPVSRFIPSFKDTRLADGRPSRPVTIRRLLTHTSGLGGSQAIEESLERTAEMLGRRPLNSEPGTRWQYSPGLNVCGRIIEVISGQAYDAFLTQRIFGPLRMVDTTFNPSPQQRRRMATLVKPGATEGTVERASHWLNDLSEPRPPNPSGGLFSTAADMARFYQMVLNGGELEGRRIVSKASVDQMVKLATGDLKTGFTPGNGWGLGWCIVRQPQGVSGMLSPGTYGHGGAFGTQGWVDPQREMIFVLMIQRTGFGNSDASAIRKAFQSQAVAATRD